MLVKCLSGEINSSIVIMKLVKLLIVVWLVCVCIMVMVRMIDSVSVVRNCVIGWFRLLVMVMCMV